MIAAWNKSLCCQNSGRAAPHNGLAVCFGYVTFPLVINDFFDGSEDAFCSWLILALFKTGAVRVL